MSKCLLDVYLINSMDNKKSYLVVISLSISLKLNCYVLVCLDYIKEKRNKTAIIIEMETCFQMLIKVNKCADSKFRNYIILV